MARSGIYKSEVVRARNKLLASGVNPSIDAVRTELGTGSKTTIHRYLKEIEEEEGGTTGAKVAVSEAIQDLVGRLAARLNEEADARSAEALAVSAASLAWTQKENSSLKAEGQTVRTQLEQAQRGIAAEKADHTKTQEALSNKNLEATQLNQRVVGLQERLEAEERHRQSLEEKHLHAREALEHFRTSAKEQREQEQRQYDQQVQYLQSELRKVTDKLTGKQQELMRAQQEGVRLIGDLSRVQAELHQAQEELRKLRPLKEALAFEQRRTEELGHKLVAEAAANKTLTANADEMQAKFTALQGVNQSLELDLAAAKAAVVAQEGVVASMLQRLSATTPPAESSNATSST
ncbi:MAG: DNA-binding protein [Betaproteobacteria bacterium]|nr:DNA-binding protein [Betaproteobacteria bacterium]